MRMHDALLQLCIDAVAVAAEGPALHVCKHMCDGFRSNGGHALPEHVRCLLKQQCKS